MFFLPGASCKELLVLCVMIASATFPVSLMLELHQVLGNCQLSSNSTTCPGGGVGL